MVAGLWLAVSPWILDFPDSDPAATRNALIVGIAIAVLSALTFRAYHPAPLPPLLRKQRFQAVGPADHYHAVLDDD